jgi:CheY-like chemotaxis protein
MNFRERRAILLDSNANNRMLLEFALAMGRIEYYEASTGQQVVELWGQNTYAFAFLDMELPDMNGLELTRFIRSRDPDIAIIIASVNDEPESVAAAVEAGCDLYLIKPFQLDMVMTLAKIINAENLRAAPNVLVIDDQSRPRWEPRSA